MPIDTQLQMLLDAMRAMDFPKIGSISAAEMRLRPRPPLTITQLIETVSDGEIPGPAGALPVRIYRPADVTDGLIVYFHGGGWVFGDLDSVDPVSRAIAIATNCTVVSVSYRLAPEHPFPAAVDDAFAAVEWAASHSREMTNHEHAPLILMGDSAGGNLAAVSAQRARDLGGPAVALQVLFYPSTEGEAALHGDPAFEPPFLHRAELGWCFDQYIAAELRQDVAFAPGKATRLGGLPPAIIVTAEYDLLTADGLAYAEKLRQAGNDVTSLQVAGAIHGFVTMASNFDIGRKVVADVAGEMARFLKR